MPSMNRWRWRDGRLRKESNQAMSMGRRWERGVSPRSPGRARRLSAPGTGSAAARGSRRRKPAGHPAKRPASATLRAKPGRPPAAPHTPPPARGGAGGANRANRANRSGRPAGDLAVDLAAQAALARKLQRLRRGHPAAGSGNEARAAEVARGRRLVQDPSYPPAAVLDSVASLLAEHLPR